MSAHELLLTMPGFFVVKFYQTVLDRKRHGVRYIGGKSKLSDWIVASIEQQCTGISDVIDIFAGSGAMSVRFKQEGWNVISNDIMYLSYVLNRGTAALNAVPDFSKLGSDPIAILNGLPIPDEQHRSDCFIYQNYSPNETCSRMYFQNENALRIDVMRQQIEQWKQSGIIDEDGYFYLLAAMINAVPSVSNITGVFGAYLKYWEPRSFKTFAIEPPSIVTSSAHVTAYNENADQLLTHVQADLMYADPPYNSRQYLPNYHVLETIAKYDAPDIHGTTGMRYYGDSEKSEFCMKRTVEGAFEKLIRDSDVHYIVISYNSEGLLPTETLSSICMSYAKNGNFHLIEKPYRRYKSHDDDAKKQIMEQLYVLEK